MTPGTESRDDLSVARYVDGEMPADELRRFEARLTDEPGLRAAVTELEGLRGWFVEGAAPHPSAGFRQRVLAASLRPDPDSAADLDVVHWAKRVLYVAAALFVLGTLAASGLLRLSDGGRLEATSQEVEQAMAALDAKIQAAREAGR